MASTVQPAPADLNRKLTTELTHLFTAGDRGAALESAGVEAVFELPEQGFGLEAIIIADEFKRPALLVRNNTYEKPRSETWASVLNPHRTKLERAIGAVGRVELKGHPSYNYVGTAWMIAERIAVTNRHVASVFARKSGSSYKILSGPRGKLKAFIDFREEFNIPSSNEIPVEKVLFMAADSDQHPDVALVQFVKGFRLPDPIQLFDGKIKLKQIVTVIGYPANDPRNPAAAVADVFGSVFEVKRLSPGEINGNPKGFIINHDCSTLGGNSGSVVLDLETGKAVGLHFGGRFRETNYAVEAAELKKILSKLKIKVPVPPVPKPQPKPDQPKTDLSNREGYLEDFLGSKAALQVPLPKPAASMEADVAKVEGADDNVLRYMHFSIKMNARRRLAFYTACNIDGQSSRSIRRGGDNWIRDPRIASSDQAGNELYSNNDLDRGHMVRRLDPVWGDLPDATIANDDTFFYTNAAPQHTRMNTGNWNNLEDYILNNTDAHNLRVNVFTGPVFADDDPEYRGVPIPQQFWKVVVVVHGETNKLHATAYMLSQKDLLTNIEFVFGQFRTYQVPVSEVQRLTTLDFGNLVKADPLYKQEAFAIREIASLRDIVL
jgi:endonuclease G